MFPTIVKDPSELKVTTYEFCLTVAFYVPIISPLMPLLRDHVMLSLSS